MPARKLLGAAALMIVLVGLTSCGGDSGQDDPAPGAGSSESPGASTTSEASPPEPTSSEVAPSTGPTLQLEGISLRMPEGCRADLALTFNATGSCPTDARFVQVKSRSAQGRDWTLEEAAARFFRDTLPGEDRPKLVDPVVIDGVEMYHGVRKDGLIDRHAYGVVIPELDKAFDILLDWPASMPRKQRETEMASVLASVEIG